MIFYEYLAAMIFGMPRALFPAIAALWYGGTTQQAALTLGLLSAAPAIAGAADNVSAILRNTMLQAAVPDDFRGRLQGVNTVVIAGGPRLGDVEAGVVASIGGEAFSVIAGSIACTVIAIGLAAKFPGFWRYDARNPIP